MEKKTYTIEQTTPRLGKAGGSVELTEREAKYWLRGGVLSDPAKAPRKTAPAEGKRKK